MRKVLIIKAMFLMMVLLFQANISFADESTKEELVERNILLEQEVEELKTIIKGMQGQQEAIIKRMDNIETRSRDLSKELDESKQAKVSPVTPSGDQLVTSKHKIKLYGFLKLDSSFDDSKTDNPDAPKYVSSESVVSNEKQYAMTAQNSRIGLKYDGPQVGDANVFGNVELDFYDTASDNSQQLRMRHAFVEVKYPKWSLLAGQTWDVFGPLGPDSLNTNGWLWNAGNIGFRRPQVRLTNNFDLNNDKMITTQLSVNRNIGIGNGTVNTGENSGAPVVEGRVAYTFPLFEKKSTIGVAGLYGQEKYNNNDGVDETGFRAPSWAVGLDMSIPVYSKLSLKGEFFYGSNLDALLAGIGQGINTAKETGVDTVGGWMQLTYKPWEKGTFNLGGGVDSPNTDDLNAGQRSKNKVAFINFVYPIVKDVNVGLEYFFMDTEYIGQSRGQNNRVTTSLIYNF